MNNSKVQIVIIDDNRKETDPLIVSLKMHFKDAEIILKVKSSEGLDYVLENRNKKTIVLLDYDLGKGELNGTELFRKIREKTSLIYVIIITANNINNIPYDELIEYINNNAFAFVYRTISIAEIKPIIEKAIHALDANVDGALEQWINMHPESVRNSPYIFSRSGKSYTLDQILEEIRHQTDFGKEMEKDILLLAIDMLARGKKKING
ncbi:MAG TPA: hypothetical protein PKI01_06520 [Bacteroidales bacterium]|nr:hypothetical protein [Bacteroidales bacterium]